MLGNAYYTIRYIYITLLADVKRMIHIWLLTATVLSLVCAGFAAPQVLTTRTGGALCGWCASSITVHPWLPIRNVSCTQASHAEKVFREASVSFREASVYVSH